MFLSENIVVLAPMEDVTDSSFRKVCKYNGADIVETEFVASDALIRNIEKSLKKLHFSEEERPLGIQIFGNNEHTMVEAVKIAGNYKPDFIDLNFGCPVRKVVEKGGGAALLKDIPKMLKIVDVVVKSTSLPVFVKTRLGWDEKKLLIVELAEKLQDCGISALTIHARTKVQMYAGLADWTLIGEVKNNPRMHIPVIGNGDVDSPEKALEMKNRYGVDGLMIGRASIGNPWIFREIKHYLKTGILLSPPRVDERIETCRRHLTSAIAEKSEKTAILQMRKHYGGYFRAFPDFKKFRMKLVTCLSFSEISDILNEILLHYKDI